MPTYGTAYELQFNRAPAGAEIHPNATRLHFSQRPWGDNTSYITSTLDRGYVPHPATGEAVVTRMINARSFATVGPVIALTADSWGLHALVNGVAVANTDTVIKRCGYGRFIGRGRAAPGDYLYATGDLQTALEGGGNAAQIIADCYGGPGYDDSELALGNQPWETGRNGLLWQSHIGVFDFVDDVIDQSTHQNDIFRTITSKGTNYTLPNGETMKDCCYAAVSPEGVVWIDPSDYGTSIPTDVQNNTANNFRNHPSVFIRRAGGAFTRAVTRRWRDERRIDIAATGSQPIGIAQQSNALVRSKWLVCIDGVASVVYIPHPGGADIRRPKDIWNQVIVPLIHNHSGNASRLVTTDFFGNIVGTETRWEFLSYARYLGDDAATVQDNTPVPG